MAKPTQQLLALALALALAACDTVAGVPRPAAGQPTAFGAPVEPAQATQGPAYPAPAATQPALPTAAPPTPAPDALAYPAPGTALPATAAPAYPPPATPDAPTGTPTPVVALCLPPEQIPPVAAAQPTPAPPGGQVAAGPIPTLGYRIVSSYLHDPAAYTQGLVYADGELYEGTGLNGQSELRRVELATGAVLQRCALPALAFGEGIALLGGAIYQLTWQNQVGMIYDQASFALRRTFSYPGQGWGLTHDGQQLIMSDGSATLRLLDPATLAERGRIAVHDDHGPVERLNELEYVDGMILANVWQTDRIARIDPQSGAVTAWIDLSGLLSAAERTPSAEVLNGIAYDAAGRRLFVTGKFWPTLFEIELVLQ